MKFLGHILFSLGCNSVLSEFISLSSSHLLMWLLFTSLWSVVTHEYWLIWGLLLQVYCGLLRAKQDSILTIWNNEWAFKHNQKKSTTEQGCISM